jgi:hypothetical protein
MHLFTDIYNWFTEGFDTADLIDAKALIDDSYRRASRDCFFSREGSLLPPSRGQASAETAKAR